MKIEKGKLISGLVIVLLIALGALGVKGFLIWKKYSNEIRVLQQMVERLEADTRIAEVLVTSVEFNPITQQHMTTIKFLEYDTEDRAMWPKYFTFAGNVIQFQSLVVRFDDSFVKSGDVLKGRSAYLFWKAFLLNGEKTQEYAIAQLNEVPAGYKIDGPRNDFEEELWREFWKYSLDSQKSFSKGIKSAQIEAPGTKFVPGVLYTLKIEHDGGIRIDTKEIPAILKGESL